LAEVYVMDAHALIELQAMDLPRLTLHQVLDEMTELVKRQRLCFPTPVVKFCRNFASDEAVTMWVNAVSGHRVTKTVDADFQTRVMDLCEDISDPDDPEESAPLFVAAMCLEMSLSTDVAIVTEDRRPQPTRTCLLEACGLIGLPTMTLHAFLAREIVTPV
jgi:hypothetical protein